MWWNEVVMEAVRVSVSSVHILYAVSSIFCIHSVFCVYRVLCELHFLEHNVLLVCSMNGMLYDYDVLCAYGIFCE